MIYLIKRKNFHNFFPWTYIFPLRIRKQSPDDKNSALRDFFPVFFEEMPWNILCKPHEDVCKTSSVKHDYKEESFFSQPFLKFRYLNDETGK